MSKEKKMNLLQLEKSYKTATKAKIKLELIERNKSTIFPCEDDYNNLKECYSLEREYALKKCRDIVAIDKELSSKKSWYDFFKSYYESRELLRDIILLFIPFIFLSAVLGYFYKESLLWLIACLNLIAIGSGFAIFSYSMNKNKKAVIKEEKEYLGPNNMQIKVLREIDKALLNGQIYEEIIKDCQLQFAKRRLASARTNNLTNKKVEAIEVNKEEDIVDIFYGNEPKVKYSYVKEKKKASDSIIYEKYMQKKREKENKEEIVPDTGIRYSFDKIEKGIKYYALDTHKDNKKIRKFISSLDKVHDTNKALVFETSATKTKSKKKASESPTYLKYMESKAPKKEIVKETVVSPITKAAIKTTSTPKKKASESSIYAKYMEMKNSKSIVTTKKEKEAKRASITRAAISTSKPKTSTSPTYQKYMEMKLAKQSVK